MNATISLDNLLLALSTLSTSNKMWIAEHLMEQVSQDSDSVDTVSSEILTHSVSVEEARRQVLDMVHDHYHKTSAV